MNKLKMGRLRSQQLAAHAPIAGRNVLDPRKQTTMETVTRGRSEELQRGSMLATPSSRAMRTRMRTRVRVTISMMARTAAAHEPLYFHTLMPLTYASIVFLTKSSHQ